MLPDWLVGILCDPEDGSPLELTGDALRSSTGSYPIREGIPRFVPDDLGLQEQTAMSFAFKWQQRDAYERQAVMALMEKDEPPRYGVQTVDQLRAIFSGPGRVLDAGCGSGHYSSLYLTDSWEGEWVGCELTPAIDAAKQRLGHVPGTCFVQADILGLPFRPATFDLVFCRGVMHHTPSTVHAFNSLARLVKPEGEFIFFVYRKNGPIREFTDDYIRSVVSTLSPEECWNYLGALTVLGKALAEARGEIRIVTPIAYLGIPAGTYSVHELMYDYFLKAYWNPQWSLEESTLISYDWYHPRYAFRHTEEEVRAWCAASGFAIEQLDARGTGFTVRARKAIT